MGGVVVVRAWGDEGGLREVGFVVAENVGYRLNLTVKSLHRREGEASCPFGCACSKSLPEHWFVFFLWYFCMFPDIHSIYFVLFSQKADITVDSLSTHIHTCPKTPPSPLLFRICKSWPSGSTRSTLSLPWWTSARPRSTITDPRSSFTDFSRYCMGCVEFGF